MMAFSGYLIGIVNKKKDCHESGVLRQGASEKKNGGKCLRLSRVKTLNLNEARYSLIGISNLDNQLNRSQKMALQNLFQD